MEQMSQTQPSPAPRRIPSVPFMTTATINITISPQSSLKSSLNGSTGRHSLKHQSSHSSFNSDNIDLNASSGRVSLRSEGSQISFFSGSGAPSRSASIRSQHSTVGETHPAANGANGHLSNGRHDGDSAVGSSPEDKASERSFGSSTDALDFREEDNGGLRQAQNAEGHAVIAMYMDKEVIAVIKVLCQSEDVLNKDEFLQLMIKITNSCGQYLRQNEEEMELTSVFVNKVKMADGKPAKEHLSELARQLSSSITISDVKFWRTTDSWTYIGAFVDRVVKSESRCTLCRACTVVHLRKTSKFAPVEEFAKQIGEQITTSAPETLGSKERALELQKLKAQSHSKGKPKTPPELLTQTYLFDSTINVAEAARRSFVDIVAFHVY